MISSAARHTGPPAVAVAGLLLLVLPLHAEEEPSPARPVAVFPAFVKDFGEVDRGEKLHHSFVVRNEGDAPLEILSASPT